MISQFGVVIYSALDSGLGSDKERHLSSGLEEIIESMTLSSGIAIYFLEVSKFIIWILLFFNIHIFFQNNMYDNHSFSVGDDEGIESDQYDTEVEESHSLDHKNR